MADRDMRLFGTLTSPVELGGHLTNQTLQGLSAYEVAVANGFVGTEAEWLASLKGETGATPDISIGNVTTGQPGTNAEVSVSGTPENPVMDFMIPRGDVGATPNMTIGTVMTGEEGTQAQATITGTPENPVLNLTIPKGDTGDAGFDPVVEVTKNGNTATVSVTDATHTTEVNIVDGYTPQKNVDYFDGHSPKITGAKSQGTTFIYSDGEQIGAIADGEDGYTPKKGVDYFDGHTPAISGEKIDDTTFIYADGVRIATVLDGIDGNSPVITTVKSGKTTSILADSVVIGTVSDGADGHSPTITTTKSGNTTTILSDGTSIGSVADGQDGHSPEITTNKVGKILSIMSDGQTIGTITDGADAIPPIITTTKSGKTTTILADGKSIGTIVDGNDGTSSTVTVSKSGKTTTVYVNGVASATIQDGVDGDTPNITASKTGKNNFIYANGNLITTIQDGASPSITTSKSGKTTTILSDGVTIGSVSDGESGYSPIKGTDYWTSSDKSEIIDDILDSNIYSSKVDKVSNATSGNFASLDSDGNLVDSGHKHSDYLTQHQDISGKADKVRNATNGNFAGLDNNGNLIDSGHSFAEFDQELIGIKGSLSDLADEVDGKYAKPSTGIPASDLANGVIPDISNKEDKLIKSYTLIYEGTVTTATGELFSNPYASVPNYTLNEQYVYRVTVDENTLESNVCEWYKPMTDGIKGSELIGNIYLSDPNLPSLIYEDTTKPYCLFYCGDGVYASLGLIIITETAGEHTVKLERVSINKSKLPRKMIYADENAPFDYSRINGSSYASINIGDNGTRNRGTAAIGYFNDTVASYGAAIGMLNVVSGQNATAIGLENTASGAASIAIGHSNTASGSDAFSEGCKSIASGGASHAEGFMSVSSGTYSHAEGYQTQAKKSYSHTEGASTVANANCSHAEGYATQTNGMCAHSEGRETLANGENQHSQGKWNIADSNGVYADIVGNGTADNNRSNAFALTWTGDGKFAGDVYVGTNADSSGGNKLATESYVANKADKVQSATSGNFASLDANGNLTDSGHKHSDYLTEAPVTDVQVNGTSVLGQDGVANIPKASSSILGVVKGGTTGIGINNDGQLFLSSASEAFIKSGTNSSAPIAPNNQHISAFYGLAKAAGDTTQSSSSNAVGTYTDNAKAAIKSMLGVQDSTQTVVVSGNTPTITALSNARYICGEVSTLTITPPGAGICEVVFTSGSTPTVLTVTGVTFPDWFDSTSLEANTTYEISISDGKGVVCTWAS